MSVLQWRRGSAERGARPGAVGSESDAQPTWPMPRRLAVLGCVGRRGWRQTHAIPTSRGGGTSILADGRMAPAGAAPLPRASRLVARLPTLRGAVRRGARHWWHGGSSGGRGGRRAHRGAACWRPAGVSPREFRRRTRGSWWSLVGSRRGPELAPANVKGGARISGEGVTRVRHTRAQYDQDSAAAVEQYAP